MPIRIVQSKQNARLKELRRALGNGGRDGAGLAGIEGPHLIEEAVRAGLHIRCVFFAPEAERLLNELKLGEETEMLRMERELLDAALTTESPQPLAALVEPPDWTWAHVLGGERTALSLIVVLAGVQDPGNLGTIVRSAEAFGASGAVCLPGTVNPWNPKCVRASAGSIFRVPLLTVAETEAFQQLRGADVRVLATTVHGAQPADLADLSGRLALVIGNEGNGVPESMASHCDGAVTIPCPGPVESLNAGVAASVLLYEASRQRMLASGGRRARRGGSR